MISFLEHGQSSQAGALPILSTRATWTHTDRVSPTGSTVILCAPVAGLLNIIQDVTKASLSLPARLQLNCDATEDSDMPVGVP